MKNSLLNATNASNDGIRNKTASRKPLKIFFLFYLLFSYNTTNDLININPRMETAFLFKDRLNASLINLKGPCATLVLCGRSVLSEHVQKQYMNCKQDENIWKAVEANYYGSPVQ